MSLRLTRRTAIRHTPAPAPPITHGYRDSAATVYDSGQSTPWSITCPTGIFNGDLVILLISQNNNPPQTVTSAPDGFTLVRRIVDGSNMCTDIYWKVASHEPATWSISYSGFTKILAHAIAYAGIDQSSPFHAESPATESGTSTSHTTATISVTMDDTILFSYAADRGATAPTWTGTDIERLDSYATGSNPNSAISQDSGGVVAQGSYSRTLTSTFSASAATMWIAALRKSTAAPGGPGLSGNYILGTPTVSLINRTVYTAPNATFTTSYIDASPPRNKTYDLRGSVFQSYHDKDALYETNSFAGGSTSHQKNNRPIRIAQTTPTSNIALVGGIVEGDQSINLTWVRMKYGQNIQDDTDSWIDAGSPDNIDPYANVINNDNQDGDPRFALDKGWAVIDGMRVRNTHDGFGLLGIAGEDGAGTAYFRNCYFQDIHDDAIENDDWLTLHVFDCFFERVYGFISCRPSASELTGAAQSYNVQTVENCIIRHYPFPGGHKRRSTDSTHSYTYKRNSNSPPIHMKDCIIWVEKFITVDTGLYNLPERSFDSYENVTIVWAGAGAYPGGTPAGCTVTTDTTQYDTAVTDWKTRHGVTDFQTVDMAKMIAPDPVP